MVTKGYIVNVYDESGKSLIDASGMVTDPLKVTQADVWLPIFDDNKNLGNNSTIGRADMCIIPHTKIPLQIQTKDFKSAVLCAIQDFDLSTLLILGYLNNKNNDKLAPYALMDLSEITIQDKTTLKGDTSLKLSKEALEMNNITDSVAQELAYVSQKDFEALYGLGTGVGNVQRAFGNLETLIENVASATGIYSVTLNTEGNKCFTNVPSVNLELFQNSYEDTYNVVYDFTYENAARGWKVRKNNSASGYVVDISTVGITLSSYKPNYNSPLASSVITIVFNSAVPVTSGGTGGTTPAQARTNLEIPSTYIVSKDEFSALTTAQPNSIFYIYG